MKGYSTKYTLTRGIVEVEVDSSESQASALRSSPRDGGTKYVYTSNTSYPIQLVVGQDFFKNRADAERNARERVTKKVASLERQISKLVRLLREWS